MKIDTLRQGVIKKLGRKDDETMPTQDHIDSEMIPSSISEDYETLIMECFVIMGVANDQIRVSVRPVGVNPAGLDVYAGFVKVVRWDPLVIEMLSRMPMIEKRIDRRVRQSNLLRYSGFSGLWFRSPAGIDEFQNTVH